jgi:hypothetical protein
VLFQERTYDRPYDFLGRNESALGHYFERSIEGHQIVRINIDVKFDLLQVFLYFR